MATTYDLHGLVKIVVADDVHRNVLSSVSNQLAGLKPVGTSSAEYTLSIETYRSASKSNIRYTGGPVERVDENQIDLPNEKVAVRFSPNNLTVYLDVSGMPINPWLQLLLVPQGVTLVHAAAVEKNGSALLLPAFGGAGKTLATGLLVRDHDYKFLGDDIVMLKADGSVLPFPRPLFFYNHHLDVFEDFFAKRKSVVAQQRILGSMKRNLVRSMPLKQFLKNLAKSMGVEGTLRRVAATREYLDAGTAEEVFGVEALGSGSPLGKIVFLQRSSGSSVELLESSSENLVSRTFAILMNEWKAEWPHVVAAAGYGVIDLAVHYRQFESILRSSHENVPAYTLMIPKTASPHEYVSHLLER